MVAAARQAHQVAAPLVGAVGAVEAVAPAAEGAAAVEAVEAVEAVVVKVWVAAHQGAVDVEDAAAAVEALAKEVANNGDHLRLDGE